MYQIELLIMHIQYYYSVDAHCYVLNVGSLTLLSLS